MLGVSPVVAQVLINRGLRDEASARAFLDARTARPASPFDLPGMAQAVERLVRAIRTGTPVIVYGDYDADGVTATAILVRALRRAGGTVGFYVPDRQTEGYGLHAEAVQQLAARAGLLLAVDCGIAAHEAVRVARTVGLDVIVLDHHLPQDALPPACVVVNPTVGGMATDYCAAGLAWQAARGTLEAMGLVDQMTEWLDLAALGTVADAVALVRDNRVIVARGLEQLACTTNPGVRALLEVAGLRPPYDVRDISHGLAPRLNAAGRLAHAEIAVRLLASDDPQEVQAIAADLDRLNAVRRAHCDQVLAEALEEIDTHGLAAAPAIVLAREGWHPGVVGIVASQIVERYHRPTVLIALRGGVGKGSARSIPPLHLVDALTRVASTLETFGGHAMAAGLTIGADAVPRFREAFLESVASVLAPEDLEPRTEVDTELTLEQVTLELAAEVARLAPFGVGNPPPVFLTRGLVATGTRMVGGGAHLRLVVSDGSRTVDAIGFRLGDLAELLAFTQARIDLTYAVEADEWRSGQTVRMVVDRLWTPEVDPTAVTADTSLLLARLFDRADEYLDPAHHAIDEVPAFHTKVVGVTFEGRQALLPAVRPGERLRLIRDPANPRDPHAIKVCLADGRPVGFLRAALAARLAPAIDAGARYAATAVAVTGGGDRAMGLNILVEREATWGGDASLDGETATRPPAGAGVTSWIAARLWRGRAPDEVHRTIIEAIRAKGRLAVSLGPGRGLLPVVASVCAALLANGQGPVAVVLPRACEADAWARVLGPWLRAIGARTHTAHGARALRARSRVEEAWRRGEVDLLVASASWMLTGPDPGALIVVADETSPEEDVGALVGRYGDRVRLTIGPVSLACLRRTAVECGLDLLELPLQPRTNLRITDHRGAGEPVLSGLAQSRSEKALILADGATSAVGIARQLRQDGPEWIGRLAYYHDGLPAALRRVLEDLYGAGAIQVLVAGSLLVPPAAPPDVARALVAGLLPTRLLALEALGAVGAAGGPARIDLRYTPKTLEATEGVLYRRMPPRETLVECYHYFRDRTREGPWVWSPREIASREALALPVETLEAALEIFVEAGLALAEGDEERGVRYTMTEVTGRVDLDRSLRHREGTRERAAWAALRTWALAPAASILADLVRA
jgi:single-stranded-DNA-specific exonuclease